MSCQNWLGHGQTGQTGSYRPAVWSQVSKDINFHDFHELYGNHNNTFHKIVLTLNCINSNVWNGKVFLTLLGTTSLWSSNFTRNNYLHPSINSKPIEVSFEGITYYHCRFIHINLQRMDHVCFHTVSLVHESTYFSIIRNQQESIFPDTHGILGLTDTQIGFERLHVRLKVKQLKAKY